MDSLAHFASAEVTANDVTGLLSAVPHMPPGMPVYIAALPQSKPEDLVQAATAARAHQLEPVPHLVARNFANHGILEKTLQALVEGAGVSRALVLGGDRQIPAGPFDDAAELLKTGLFTRDTIGKVAFGCYPEAHPTIPRNSLDRGLHEKLELSARFGLDVRLITQICFDDAQIIRFIRQLRTRGIDAPIRFGVVGPTKLTTLAKYAAACGVGPSLMALMKRPSLGRQVFGGYHPRTLIEDVFKAAMADPTLNILGPHFFTFGSLKRSVDWMAKEGAAVLGRQASASDA